MIVRRFSAVLAVLMSAGCVATCPTASTPPSAKRVDTDFTMISDVVFTPPGWPKALEADIYQPKGDGVFPGVLLIYGGSWSSADHRWQMKLLARKLARRGYVVMNATYRGTPEFKYPAPVDDLREALRWMRAHAADYHINSQKVATYGFSAGGHLAALVGVLDGPPEVQVQAIVAASAPADLTLYPGGEILPRFLGATYEENPGLYRDASPVSHVTPNSPPVFIYQGTDDKTVSPDHSRAIHAALDRAGVPNELRWVEGKGHAAMLLLAGDAEDAAVDFLDRTLR